MNESEAKIVTLPSAQQIETEAASWLVVLGREQVSAEDRMEFKRWLRQSERHRAAFDTL
ncbi:FecR/PupR family sigma factor regulator, partial [Steroidobacter sp.]|uniref:FecR/PupR family sigma factor regulator n=1 Tax=Steroidobacter sp. TaxID=1978227 RepID=UPI001A3F61C3|nr:FecR/PupR family sigma factor regulator [Steroidobacter sp.]